MEPSTWGMPHTVTCNGNQVGGEFANRHLARLYAEDESGIYTDEFIVRLAATGQPVYFVQYGKWWRIQAR